MRRIAFTLERVSVRRGDALVLDDVTCQIGSGVATALVGASGAGKSTLLRLLNRLEEPVAGVVRLHGEPLPTLDVLELRRKVGLVGQQPVLLTETVLEDLRVGRPDLTSDEAGPLLESVHLPAEMHARGTSGLSGGEAQRVCLARALAVGPPISGSTCENRGPDLGRGGDGDRARTRGRARGLARADAHRR